MQCALCICSQIALSESIALVNIEESPSYALPLTVVTTTARNEMLDSLACHAGNDDRSGCCLSCLHAVSIEGVAHGRCKTRQACYSH